MGEVGNAGFFILWLLSDSGLHLPSTMQTHKKQTHTHGIKANDQNVLSDIVVLLEKTDTMHSVN